MKLTDLRVGNILLSAKTGAMLIVIGVEKTKVIAEPTNEIDVDQGDELLDHPLSETVLRQLGCKKSENDEHIWRTPEGKLFTFRKKDNTVVVQIFGRIVEIKTVHDFQNCVNIAGEEIALVK